MLDPGRVKDLLTILDVDPRERAELWDVFVALFSEQR